VPLNMSKTDSCAQAGIAAEAPASAAERRNLRRFSRIQSPNILLPSPEGAIASLQLRSQRGNVIVNRLLVPPSQEMVSNQVMGLPALCGTNKKRRPCGPALVSKCGMEATRRHVPMLEQVAPG
jgi:hypothetical protein